MICNCIPSDHTHPPPSHSIIHTMMGNNIIPEVMWPRLVASKLLRKRLGSTNFVADFPSNNADSFKEDVPSSLGQPSLSADSFFDDHKDSHNYKVFVSTWNVGGVAPREDIDVEDWLDTGDNLCDIYVLGFQEIVPLRASNVLGSENNRISMKWNSLIREALNKKTKEGKSTGSSNINIPNNFRCVISKQMVGILVSVWIRADLLPYVRHPSVSCVGCGIMGCLGNKGSVSVRFQLYGTSFCFICCHLASGGREGDQQFRNSDVADILSRTSFPRGRSLGLPRKVVDHDRVILLGDLNYRISLPEATTRSLVDQRDWNSLLGNDQLRTELLNGQVLEHWHEGSINFAPTYKYYVNSDVYFGCVQGRKGEKCRAPAWCDRIIWYGEGLKQHIYTRGESKFSDHRPVKATFNVEVEAQSLKGLQRLFLSERFNQLNFEVSPPRLLLADERSSFKL